MNNLIRGQIVYCLYDATWPFNLKLFHDGVVGQTEVDALVVLRKAVHATTLFAQLCNRSSGREQSRADTITIRNNPFQVNFEPVIIVPDIPEELRRSAGERRSL